MRIRTENLIKKAISYMIIALMILCILGIAISADKMDKLQALTTKKVYASDTIDTQGEAIQIKTYSELASAAKHTDGNYILMADIDMSKAGDDGWKPWDFNGKFDGNGHTLYNMDIKAVTDITAKSYDGNLKEYDTYFAGFFGITDGAVISNLNISGAYIELGMTSDAAKRNTFAAVLVGYMNNTTIDNCNIDSSYVSLTSTSQIWGTGGVAGFGNGLIENTKAEVTQVCIDADPDDTDRDEQFMGGIYADGYIDVKDCTVTIDGYISERGYVHSGGIAGLYILYPVSGSYVADIAGNTINGMITFFEDNTDRRAYCRVIAGERMNAYTTSRENIDNFTRNEVSDYTQTLKPQNYERKLYTVDNPYEESSSDNKTDTNINIDSSVSSGELIEGVNDNAETARRSEHKIGQKVLFSGMSEAARVAIIIVVVIAAVGAYYFITRHIRRKK